MRDARLGAVEATPAAQSEWLEHTQALVRGTLRAKYDSWYLGANIPGKPRVFMIYTGGLGSYKDHCDSAATDGYRGFEFTPLAEGASDSASGVSHRAAAGR